MGPTRWPTDHANMGDMPRSNYEPPDDAAKVFTRYKRAVETLADKDPLRDMAVREMRDRSATVGDLARLTGLSDEYFRRIAREEGIERRRPPTVGKLTGTLPSPTMEAVGEVGED